MWCHKPTGEYFWIDLHMDGLEWGRSISKASFKEIPQYYVKPSDMIL